MVFHEITPEAIQRAIDEPRDLDRRLVDAQEARRILDRLYGYEVCPSCGRRCSRACPPAGCRASPPASWSSASGSACASSPPPTGTSTAHVRRRRDDRDATSAPPSSPSTARASPPARTSTRTASCRRRRRRAGRGRAPRPRRRARRRAVRGALGRVASRTPAARTPPFMTSTLQQEAGRKLRFGVGPDDGRGPAPLRERLHHLHADRQHDAVGRPPCRPARARSWRSTATDYLPDAPRQYTSKVKNAQEAHEAIRPAGDRFRLARGGRRASSAPTSSGSTSCLAAHGRLPDDRRPRRVRPGPPRGDRDRRPRRRVRRQRARPSPPRLPAGLRGGLRRPRGRPRGPGADPARPGRGRRASPPAASRPRATRPSRRPATPRPRWCGAWRSSASAARRPTRRSSAPSRTAATCGRRARPSSRRSPRSPSSPCSRSTSRDLVDYAFTARMEDDLDEIASGDRRAGPVAEPLLLRRGRQGRRRRRRSRRWCPDRLGDIDARAVNTIPIGADADGVADRGPPRPLRARTSSGARTPRRIPEDLPPDELTPAKAIELLEAPKDDRVLGQDPETGLSVWPRPAASGPTSSSATSRPTRSTASPRPPRCSRR